MNTKRTPLAATLVALTLALTGLMGATAVQAGPWDPPAAEVKKSRLVIDVSDNDETKWNRALNNARNVQKDLGAANVEIEMVMSGPGLSMGKADSTVANRITEAVESGVKVVACQNTMKAQKVTKEDMHSKVGYVPAGIVELIKLQDSGWAYVRN